MNKDIALLFHGMKNSTAKLIFYFLISGGKVSKADLTMFSPPTVRDGIADLLREGLIIPTENYGEYSLTRSGAFFCKISNYEDYPETPIPEQSQEGFIYFIQAGDMVKIGFATDPTRRMDDLQVGNPNILKLLAALPANHEDEKFFHARFENERVRGEWFKLTANIRSFTVDPTEQKTFLSTTTALNIESNKQKQQRQEEEAKKIFLLGQVGVGSPTKETLARMDHCTVGFIQAHIAKWRKEKKAVPLLIHRLRSGDSVGLTDEQQRQRYYDNAYKDSLEHDNEEE